MSNKKERSKDANDPIIVTVENKLEDASLRALSEILSPWRITWVDGRDDVGRDGYVQMHVTDGVITKASSITCGLQAKATRLELPENAHVTVETRHLSLWSDETASPIMIGLWSRRSQELRIRTAREVLTEVDLRSPEWKRHETVTILFRSEHTVPTNRSSTTLRRMIVDELDAKGGRVMYHRATRRVLLSHLFTGLMSRYAVTGEDKISISLFVGPGWRDEDIDADDSDPGRILISSLLLYEEIWLPFPLIKPLIKLLGREDFLAILKAGRLVFWQTPAFLGIMQRANELAGDMGLIQIHGTDGNEYARTEAQKLERDLEFPGLSDAVYPFIQIITSNVIERALEETRQDIARSDIRCALSLPLEVHDMQSFPIWDVELYNRLLYLNYTTSIANNRSLDVIDHEAGLAWLSSTKLAATSFQRRHDGARGLDLALAANQLPDLGQLYHTLGLHRCVSLALRGETQDFRDWYWEYCAPSWSNEPTLRDQFRGQAQRILGIDARAMHFSQVVRLSYVGIFGGEAVVIATPDRGASGISRRATDSRAVLARQISNHQRARLVRIQERFGTLPDAYARCPCGSGASFRFCCGTRP